jgi:hypothetical protein
MQNEFDRAGMREQVEANHHKGLPACHQPKQEKQATSLKKLYNI